MCVCVCVCVCRLRQLEPSVTCVDDVTRLMYCGMCRGQVMTSATPRCRGHCSNVVRACLGVRSDVNAAWNDYLCQSSSPSSCLCLSACRYSLCSRCLSNHIRCWWENSYVVCYSVPLLHTTLKFICIQLYYAVINSGRCFDRHSISSEHYSLSSA